jgi:hypothetical protein
MSQSYRLGIALTASHLLAAAFGAFILSKLEPTNAAQQNADLATFQSKEVANFPTPPSAEWEPMKNPSSYARNYVRREKRDYEVFPQVITIYEVAMTRDRRDGTQISDSEYLKIFKIFGEPNNVVIEISTDKKHYWLLSRQRIDLSRKDYLIKENPEQNEKSFNVFHFALQDIVDTTRHFMMTKL